MAKKRLTQEHLDGMEPMPKNNKVHNLAVKYADARDEHAIAKRKRDGVHDSLVAMMIQEGLETYIFGDITVKLKDKKTVGVKIKIADGDEEEEGDE